MKLIKDKASIIKGVIGSLDKQFGKGTLMALNGKQPIPAVKAISTGSINLDLALGIGGLPRGRLVEIFGPESSGKTTLALHALAEMQRASGLCVFIDAEHALDIKYAKALGVDLDSMLLSQPDYGEQALEVADQLIQSGAIDLIVIDSVAALVPKSELEGQMGDVQVGLQARLMSQAMRKLAGSAYRHDVLVIFINQTRQKIGVTYGSNKTTSGGMALKFYTSIRLEVARIGAVKDGEKIIGNQTRVKVVKNKVAPPFRTTDFEIIYGRGIHRTAELLDAGIESGMIKKSGAWFSYKDESIAQGRVSACRYLDDNPKVSEAILLALKKPMETEASPKKVAA